MKKNISKKFLIALSVSFVALFFGFVSVKTVSATDCSLVWCGDGICTLVAKIPQMSDRLRNPRSMFFRLLR